MVQTSIRAEPLSYFTFRDLEFERVPVQRRSTMDTPYLTWEAVGMPRIPPSSLDVVCYLYDSVETARHGKEFGGTGFLVGLPSERFPKLITHVYVVTNWHVACRGNSVVRINTKDGAVDILDYGPDQWHFLPKYDLAVLPIPLDHTKHKYKLMPPDGFMTKESMARDKIGPGDDVFMVGRFVDHDGGIVNQPAVRFGHISVMPTPIEQPNGVMADAFCIDVHSRTGYSGSPVFVYRTPGYDLEERHDPKSPNLLCSGVNLLVLLGVHFAQFPEQWEIESGTAKTKKESGESLITEGKYVKGLSGMTCVLPSWTIMEVIDMPELKKIRDHSDAVWAEKLKESGLPPDAEVVFNPNITKIEDLNPNQREDFNRLLAEAVKRPKSSDQT